MFKGVRLKLPRFCLTGAFVLLYVTLAGLLIYLLSKFPEQIDRSMAAPTTESVEQFALRFMETLTQPGDRAPALKMLCADNGADDGANINEQIGFWIGSEITGAGHNFRVVRTILLPPWQINDSPTHKVWVAFRYTYRQQGQERDLDLSDGWAVYVTRLEHGFCVSPWADQHNDRFALTKK